MGYEEYKKELESFLTKISKSLGRANNATFMCDDGHFVSVPLIVESEKDEVMADIKLLSLFRSCRGAIVYINTLGLISLNTAVIGCRLGIDSDTMTDVIRDVINYVLPPSNLRVASELVFSQINEMLSDDNKYRIMNFIKDPLEQVFSYYSYFLTWSLQDLVKKLKFVCPSVFYVDSGEHASYLAYCIPFDVLAREGKQEIDTAVKSLEELRRRVASKILNHLAKLDITKNYQLCKDINTFIEPVEDDLVEAEKLMRRYYIVRAIAELG